MNAGAVAAAGASPLRRAWRHPSFAVGAALAALLLAVLGYAKWGPRRGAGH